MGIKNGIKFYSIFQQGLYNKHAKNIKVYVDGELIRHKGKTSENISMPEPEENIAKSSFKYLMSIIRKIEEITKNVLKPSNVYVYMDGNRVLDKIFRKSDPRFNDSIIKSTFVELCVEFKYNVVRLVDGESELQMYLSRDQTSDLNVFVTSDSDLFSICCSHEPIIDNKSFNKNVDFANNKLKISKFEQLSYKDLNYEYFDDIVVRDSCVWLSCKKDLQLIGFDGAKYRLNFNVRNFRVFIALCGTDFTDHLFTESMVDGILRAFVVDVDFLDIFNDLTNVYEIALALLYIGVKNGGSTIKKTAHKQFCSDLINFETIVEIYVKYIETGTKNISSPSLGSMYAVMEILYNLAKGGKFKPYKLSDFRILCDQQSLKTCITNLRLGLNNFLLNQFNYTEIEIKKKIIDLIR